MNKNKYILFLVLLIFGCATPGKVSEEEIHIQTYPKNAENILTVEFIKGEAFNHPSFVIWTEDLEGNYIETLYVTQFVAKGKFGHGEIEPGRWSTEPGTLRRAATLPYWAHKRNTPAADGLYVPSPETAVPDALTSATPQHNFVLKTATSVKNKKFRILLEINQPWDSNKFWTNNKFPDDIDYFTSLQPALVYAVTIDPNSDVKEYYLNPIGHSEHSGKNGKLYTDLSTLTTAKEIADKIIVQLR